MTDIIVLPQPQPFAIPSSYGAGGTTGAKGDPGANVLAIGLFAALASLSIPGGTTLIQTSGHSSAGRGHALYIEDTSLTDPDVAAYPATIGKSSNGRYFRLAPDQIWRLEHFGVIGDGNVANAATNIAALNAVKAYQAKYSRSGVGYGTGGHSIWWGYNDVHIGANTFDISDVELNILGEGCGGSAAGASIIRTTGTTAVRIQNADTTGATGTRVVSLATGNGSRIIGVIAQGDYAGGTEVAAHGFHIRGTPNLVDCGAYGFAGNGFFIDASSGSANKGNANCWKLINCFAQGNLNGFYALGDDANAGIALGCNATANRCYGFRDSSFLANHWSACHAAANGWDGALGSIPTGSTLGGYRYYVKPGQAVGASTNAPPGTPTSNTWWGYTGAGGAYNGVVAWVSGTQFREGGGYRTDNPNASGLFSAGYSETDQNPPLIDAPFVVEAGALAVQNRGTALSVRSDTAGAMQIGPSAGDARTGAITINCVGAAASQLTLQSWAAGVPSVDWQISSNPGAGANYIALHYHEFYIAGLGRTAYFDTNALNLDAGKVVNINGAKVLDSRFAKPGSPALSDVIACLDHHGLWG